MCTMKVMLSLVLLAASAIYMASADKNSNCCTKVSRGKPNPSMQIESYYIQTASPPCVEAVMFVSGNRIICAHPNLPWVKKKLQELRKKEEDNKKTK
ncbi:C-C motif chemokine 19-like [Dendropsophus ebraccatus]|uniref:C-C motif chemokine 19-like n=1 Tax=Dendropsophus ebraccatus TaxID=150705 RepID=UPI0038312272